MDTIQRQTVQNQIEQTKKVFSQTDNDKLYDGLNGASMLLLKYKQHDGKDGWSNNIVDKNGSPVYSPEEQVQVEGGFKSMAAFIDPIILDVPDTEKLEPNLNNPRQNLQNLESTQKGGENLKPGFSSGMVQYDNPFGSINPEDISLDKAYNNVSEYISELDEKNRILARTLGPFRFINEMPTDPQIPLQVIGLPPLIIPARSIVPVGMMFLEMLRLLVSFGPLSSNLLRNISSLVLALADLANGSWKNAILTVIGGFGSTPLLMGLMGKLLNNTFELMSPEIRRTLSKEVFRGTKSVFIGFWLYLFSIFSPSFVRDTVNQSLQQLTEPLEEFNKKIGDLGAKLQQQVGPGLRVEMQGLPLQMMPSIEDIQNIQILAQRPEIYCSPEFQNAIDPLMKLVPMRLILELLNVPVQKEDKEAICAGQPTDISAAITKQLEPKISVVGGTRRRQHKRKSKNSKRRKTLRRR